MSGPDASIEESPESTTAHRRKGKTGVLSIRVILGDQVSAHPLPTNGEITLGRGGDVVISNVNVSRNHLKIRSGNRLEVCDLGSTNQSALHGSTLEPNTWLPVRAGDVVVLGGEALVVMQDGDVRSVPTRHMGREALDAALEQALAMHRTSDKPFAVVSVQSRSTKKWLDVIAGIMLERDQMIVVSENEALLVLTHRSEEQSDAIAKLIEEHLVRMQAAPRVRLRHCPRDGTKPEDLIEKPADNRAQRTTMRPAGPLVRNAQMMKLYSLVDEVAPTPVNILILGETGVGKDVLANALHERSPRSRGAFVSLNCAALPETLLESELFGYERGAFTGAVTSKPGLLETAEGGTIFLDEVGEMPLPTQAKFLRVLEDRTVRRVGGLKQKPIDVRVIAATNRDLQKDIAAQRFRADLYYRLNGLSLTVPPLRDRVDEITALASSFAANAAAVLNKPTPRLSPEATACLESYSWPGNIRELRNAIERAVLLARERVITLELLPPEIASAGSPTATTQKSNTPRPRPPLPTFSDEEDTGVHDIPLPPAGDTTKLMGEVEQLERQRVIEALAKCNGNQTRAAALLGITRRMLISRIERYNLPRPRGPQTS